MYSRDFASIVNCTNQLDVSRTSCRPHAVEQIDQHLCMVINLNCTKKKIMMIEWKHTYTYVCKFSPEKYRTCMCKDSCITIKPNILTYLFKQSTYMMKKFGILIYLSFLHLLLFSACACNPTFMLSCISQATFFPISVHKLIYSLFFPLPLFLQINKEQPKFIPNTLTHMQCANESKHAHRLEK